MKKYSILFIAAALTFAACNNEGSDGADDMDSTDRMGQTDNGETGSFMVKAAEGGMAEVEAGKVAETKATHPSVKQFAGMMVQDHTAANNELKSLAGTRQVNLPAGPDAEHVRKTGELNQKSGSDFDKAYMEMMVDDHKKTVDLFEDASEDNDIQDAEVKAFISKTLPKLRAHLDSAQAIHDRIK